MGALEVMLYPRSRAGALTADQQARFRELMRQFKKSLPLIARLKLYCPPVPLDV
jgi:hypothetical protein